MALLASPALHQPPPSDAERERIRELSRYYCNLGRPSKSQRTAKNAQGDLPPSPTAPHGDEQPGIAYLSSDITLTALTQLGVHRLACNRSFLSLIDGNNQHIVAESTASISLRDKDKHLPDDGLYLGVRTLDLIWGVCPHTVKLFTGQDVANVIETPNVTANRTRYIIRDFTKDDCFKDRPYVVDWPHMRFYAEVPVYSPSGYVLGTYCVVDDKPRAEFNDDAVETLQEIADAIAQHLENNRIVHCHQRAERLVKNLTTFAKGQTDPETVDCQPYYRRSSISSLPGPQGTAEGSGLATKILGGPSPTAKSDDNLGVQAMSLSTELTGEVSPLLSGPYSSERTETTSLSSNAPGPMAGGTVATTPLYERPLEEVAVAEESMTADSTGDSTPMVTVTESVAISQGISSIFSRASALLRDSMDLDGVVFLDASPSNAGIVHTGDWEPLPRTADPAFRSNALPSSLDISGDGSLLGESNKPCDPLGFALRTTPDHSVGDCPIALPDALLQQMVSTFPQGQIFNLDDRVRDVQCDAYLPEEEKQNPNNPQSTEIDPVQEIAAQLANRLPGAKSVLFFPLYDWNKTRWLAGTLVWSHDSDRALGLEELHYFKVFGDSIISEVARLEWATTERSKSDFISSVSHEIRSPLHGMLASAELLHTTPLQSAQHDMVRMVEKCGMTLLDTMNHLLDFTKINNLTTAKKKKGATPSKTDVTNLVSVFDLDNLVEDVTNILYTGQRISQSVTDAAGQGLSSSLVSDSLSPGAQPDSANNADEPTVVVRIEKQDSWKVQSVTGAWRRIVMNLLGNALKYTRTGFIEISLSQAKKASNSRAILAHLSVTDTGCGIAPDFLKHKLFSPFSQENSLSQGVGLGLTVVRQLVTSLSGHIHVKSEMGVGTQVDVFIPVRCLEPPSRELEVPESPRGCPEAIPQESNHAMQVCLIGFNGCPDLKEVPTGILTAEAKRKLSIQNSLTNVFSTQPAWTVSFAESLDKAHGDVAVIEEAKLSNNMVNGRLPPGFSTRTGFQFFIILSTKAPFFDAGTDSNIIRVSQPFGPRKFRQAVKSILALHERSKGGILILGPRDPSETVQGSIPLESSGVAEPVQSPPVAQEISADSDPCPSTTPQEPKKKNGVHVLIVDDNGINLKILATFMRKIGCSYDTASNGLIALEKYRASSRRYDYILMDISMPVMDGLMSTSKIREYEKAQGLSPSTIMAVTGVASAAMQQRAMSAGIDDYLVKPISLNELRKTMNVA